MAGRAQIDADAASSGTWVEAVNLANGATYPDGRRPKFLIVGTGGNLLVVNEPGGSSVTVAVTAGRVDLSPHAIAAGGHTAAGVTAVF